MWHVLRSVAYITDLIVIKSEVDQIEQEPAFVVNRMPPEADRRREDARRRQSGRM